MTSWPANWPDLDKKRIGYNDDIQRYKGLGEMDADQLADTTMDPRTRMLRRIRMEDAAQASEIFSLLMGDDVPPAQAVHRRQRRRFRPLQDRYLTVLSQAPSDEGVSAKLTGGEASGGSGLLVFLSPQSVFGGQLFRQRVLRYIIRISSSAPPPITFKDNYDIIGFDPRGVADSTPVYCGQDSKL